MAPLLPTGAPPTGAPPPPTGLLPKLEMLRLTSTQVADAGCAALAAAFDSSALPALEGLLLLGIPASGAAIATVNEALAKSRARARAPFTLSLALATALAGIALALAAALAGMALAGSRDRYRASRAVYHQSMLSTHLRHRCPHASLHH